MTANNYISKNEHRLLLIVAFSAFAFVVSTFTFHFVKSYNDYIIEQHKELKSRADNEPYMSFSGGNSIHQIPGHHFLILFVFLSLLKTKRFLLPAILTVFYTSVFIYGLFVRASYIGFDSPNYLQSSLIEQFYFVANPFDFFAFIIISILLFWHISILLRMLIITSQRKNVLP